MNFVNWCRWKQLEELELTSATGLVSSVVSQFNTHDEQTAAFVQLTLHPYRAGSAHAVRPRWRDQ